MSITVVIPLRIEHIDRYINTELVINYIANHFDYDIIVIENSAEFKIPLMNIPHKRITYIQQESDNKIFPKTKMIKDGIELVKTEITMIYDADILLPLQTFKEVENYILHKNYHIVQPFSNPPGCTYIHQKNKVTIDPTKNIDTYLLKKNDKIGFAGKGFVVCVNTAIWKSIGGENEDFLSYGPEDNERYFRFTTLGYNSGVIDGKVFHLEHFRGDNSSTSNPHFNNNHKLYESLKTMSVSELKDYYAKKSRFK